MDKTEETEETKFELDEEAVKAIAQKASDNIVADSAKIATEAATKAVEMAMASLETVNKKTIVDTETKEAGEKGTVLGTIKVKSFDSAGYELGEVEVESKFAGESKEMRFLKAAKALANGDFATLNEYKQDALQVREKAGYANEGTDADGAVLVPYPDFDTTVHENLPKYGVAAANATIRTVMSNQVKQIGLSSELTFVSTAEAAAKTGGKLALNSEVKALAKFALIVTATDELTEDSAIDFWGLVTREMARALAKLQDQIVFTNLATSPGGSGIAHTSGVITQPVSGAGTTITWDDLLAAEGKLEDNIDSSGYKWYMRKETWFRLLQLKADNGTYGSLEYLAQTMANNWVGNPNNPTTPWGTPVVFTRVLTQSIHLPNPGTEAVFGDLSYYTLYQKRGMVVTALREATVKDSAGSDFNLATQDGTALRFVVRLLGFLNSNDASRFVIVGQGTVS